MPNYQGVWSLSEQYQNASGWPSPPLFQRALFAGGYSTNYDNTIDYVTITSAGNATDFGDLTVSPFTSAGTASATRGVVGGGQENGTALCYGSFNW
jgi:hypothetical protein